MKEWTFALLAEQKEKTMNELMNTGVGVKAVDVSAWEYRGWNLNPITVVTCTRKSKKGFYREPNTGKHWGYNVRVKQGKINEPWVALPSEDNPKRFYFFG